MLHYHRTKETEDGKYIVSWGTFPTDTPDDEIKEALQKAKQSDWQTVEAKWAMTYNSVWGWSKNRSLALFDEKPDKKMPLFHDEPSPKGIKGWKSERRIFRIS